MRIVKHSITSIIILLLLGNGVVAQDQLTNNGNLQLHPGAAIAFFGDFVNDGTFTATTSTVIFNGSSAQSIGGTSTTTFYNLDIDNSNGVVLDKAVAIDNDLTITNGTFNVNTSNYQINLGGDFTNNGAFNAQSGKIVFDGTATQQVSGTATTTFNNIDLTNTAATGLQIETNTNLKGTLTLSANTSFDADGTSGTSVFTLLSTADNPTSDAGIGAILATASITGNLNIQRYMSGEGKLWRYIGSPVDGTTVADWQANFPITGSFTGADVLGGANNASLYRYDETISGVVDYGWTAYPVSSNTESLVPGRGFAAFIRESVNPTTIDVRGAITSGVNRGTVNLNLTYTESSPPVAAADGYNLVANTYPAALDWNALYDDLSTTNVDGVMYIADNGSGSTQYKGYDAQNNQPINGGTQYIAIGQAFWVKANGANPSLTVTESMKTNNSHSFYRTVGPTNYVRIKLSQGSLSDETLIFFYPDAIPGKDMYDSYKLYNDIFNLSSLMADGSHMVTNAWGSLDCNSTVTLSIENVDPVTYTLNFSALDSFLEPVRILLYDNYLNNLVEITDGFNYDFDVTNDSSSYGDSRFQIHFDTEGIETNINLISPDIACKGHTLKINLGSTQTDIQYQAFIDDDPVSRNMIGTGNSEVLRVYTDSFIEGTNTITILASKAGCSEHPLDQTIDVTYSLPLEVETTVGDVICAGNTAIFTATGAEGGSIYRWYLNTSGSDPDFIGPFYESDTGLYETSVLTQTTQYLVSIINSDGCEGARKEITAQVVPQSEITSITGGQGCEIASVTLYATGTPEDGSYRWYSEQNSETPLAETSKGEFITPVLSQSTSYFVAAVNSLGCEGARKEIRAYISPHLDLSISMDAKDLICNSEDMAITLDSSQPGVKYYTKDSERVVSDTIIGTGEEIKILVPAANLDSGKVSLQVYAINEGCNEILPLNQSIEANKSSVSEVVFVRGDKICNKSIAMLYAYGAVKNELYRWYEHADDHLPIEITKYGIFETPILSESHTYYVSVLNQSGCKSERKPVEANVIKLEQPVISVDTLDYETYLLASNYPTNNQWYFNSSIMIGDTLQSLTTSNPGNYQVEVSSGGCPVISDTIKLLNMVTGISESPERITPVLYPNPATDKVMVKFPALKNQDIRVMIYSVDGKVQHEVPIKYQGNNNIVIDLTPYKPGTYMLKVFVNSDTYFYRLFKQ